MTLQKIAYSTNWMMIVVGFLLPVPFTLPQNIIQSNNIFSLYQDGFGLLFVVILILMFGLFASCLALVLQIKHLIVLSLLLFISPFLWIAVLWIAYTVWL